MSVNLWNYTINRNENEDENEKQIAIYDMNLGHENSSRPRHGHKYCIYKNNWVWWCLFV